MSTGCLRCRCDQLVLARPMDRSLRREDPTSRPLPRVHRAAWGSAEGFLQRADRIEPDSSTDSVIWASHGSAMDGLRTWHHEVEAGSLVCKLMNPRCPHASFSRGSVPLRAATSAEHEARPVRDPCKSTASAGRGLGRPAHGITGLVGWPLIARSAWQEFRITHGAGACKPPNRFLYPEDLRGHHLSPCLC